MRSTMFPPRSGYFQASCAFAVAALCLMTRNAYSTRIDTCSTLREPVPESANLFTDDIYQILTKPGQPFDESNVLMSPLSIHLGLAMLRAGAAGKTEQEISKGIRINRDLNETEIHQGFKDLISSLKESARDEDRVRIELANRVFVGQVYSIKRPFLDSVRSSFFADAEQVNFGDTNGAAGTVNNWVRKATRNRIKSIVVPSMLNNHTAMILVNAIHFKGEWKFPFNPENTSKNKRFTTIDGKEILVEMMQLDRARRFKYGRLPELKSTAVALPYTSHRFSFVILLPDRDENLREVEERLKDDMLSEIPCRLRHTPVDVRLPKLIMESNIDLIASKALENLGMTSMTTEFADFTRLSDEPGLRITNVIHKAFLEINEAGSEAAAATAFVAQARSLIVDPGDTVKFIVDRPFIGYIYDSVTKSVLFVGRKVM